MWGLVLAALLFGAATGGWWSRRRAVAHAYVTGHASGEASAVALAQGGSVTINGSPSESAFDDWDAFGDDVDRISRERAHQIDVRRRAEFIGRVDVAREHSHNGRGLGNSRPDLVQRQNWQVNDD
jgi:hypothetical protein